MQVWYDTMSQSWFKWLLLGDSVVHFMLVWEFSFYSYGAEVSWMLGFATLSVASLATCWLVFSVLWLFCFCPGHAAAGRSWSLGLVWLACVLSVWPEAKVPLWWLGPWRLAATWLQSHLLLPGDFCQVGQHTIASAAALILPAGTQELSASSECQGQLQRASSGTSWVCGGPTCPAGQSLPHSQIGVRLLSLASRYVCPPEPASQGEGAGAQSLLSSLSSPPLAPSPVLSTLLHLSNPPF